jgi:hypothetical protein
MAKLLKLKIEDILIDETIHPRHETNEDIVTEYAAAMNEKAKFPPLIVFWDEKEKSYRLADGHHRVFAYMRVGIKFAECETHYGNRADCIKFSLGCNIDHGLRRTNEDKRKAVEIALREFPKLGDRVIADLCKVTHPFISSIRKAHVVTVTTCDGENPNKSEVSEVPPRQKRTGRDGKEYSVPERPKKNQEAASEVPERPKVKAIPVTVDATQLPVPVEILEFWDMGIETSRRILSLVSEVKNVVADAHKVNNPLFREVDHIDVIAKLESAYTSLKVIKPFAVCYKCNGVTADGSSKSCPECHGRGFISEFYYKTHISEERKKLREKALAKKK